jgi:hypothetical protein
LVSALAKGRRDAQVHEAALQASRSVMKRALSEIVFYGGDEKCAAIAAAALQRQSDVYAEGLR